MIYHENAHGRVACFDAASGRELWSANLLERFGGQNITWGMSECLLVDDRKVYATAGGKEALLVALDKKTGATLWKTPPLIDSGGDGSAENASYASPILAEIAGRRLIIGCSLRHLYCADAATGALQWTRRFPTTYSVISMIPALVGNGVFMTAPHGKGGKLFQLKAPASAGGVIEAEERWGTPLDTLQGCVVQTAERIIGSYYGGRKGWAALNANSGECCTTFRIPPKARRSSRRIVSTHCAKMVDAADGSRGVAVQDPQQVPIRKRRATRRVGTSSDSRWKALPALSREALLLRRAERELRSLHSRFAVLMASV
jgi:hypothetical protein